VSQFNGAKNAGLEQEKQHQRLRLVFLLGTLSLLLLFPSN
jgi:hypothetical protein